MTPLRTRRRATLRIDRRGAAALETALVMMPFMVLLFCTLQVAFYFISQAALDTGVLRTAEQIRAGMVAGATFVAPTGPALKANIETSGSVPTSGGTLSVEIRPLTSLMSAGVAIVDGTIDVGGPGSILVIRARLPVLDLAFGMAPLAVTSAAIVRRPAF